jgi:hypothetical protein
MKFFSADSQTKLARSFVATNDLSLRKEIRMAKFSKKPTKKRKKLQRLRTSLPVRDLAKNENSSFRTSVESSTPKISFQPNFSSMLPSEAESSQRSRHFFNHSPDAKPTTIDKAAPIKNSPGSNLPIPPLLPINKSCEFSSRPSATSAMTTNPTVRSPTSLLRTSTDASLPLPTVLLPYPILLPIVLPIPIPIPVPISATKTQTTENGEGDKFDDKKDDDNLDI